jgi:hypothetical protein
MGLLHAIGPAFQTSLHPPAVQADTRQADGSRGWVGDARQRLIEVRVGPLLAVLCEFAADLNREIPQMTARDRNLAHLPKSCRGQVIGRIPRHTPHRLFQHTRTVGPTINLQNDPLREKNLGDKPSNG